MFKLTVLYPKNDGSTFDMEYYRTKHVPLVNRVLGPERVEIDQVVDGPYMAVGHFYYPSHEALQAALGGPDVGEAMADVPNYTNVDAQLQISEVVE
jgi:uncharacterized protein (TIGR02118 family)